MQTDNDLLEDYALHHSEAAFAEIVRRHGGMVYSAALRESRGDVPHAQDITQAVFTLTARKAARLRRHPALAGWLYTCVRQTSANMRRAEQRRQRREAEAYAMGEILSSDSVDAQWRHLQPFLDDAMHELNEAERATIVLRFFEGRTHKQVGVALGLTETSARKRVERALEKLRVRLARRGLRSSAAALAAVLTGNALSGAPAGFLATVTATAVLTRAAVGAASAFATLRFMSMTKVIKIGATALLLTGAATTIVSQHQNKVRLMDQGAELNRKIARLQTDNQRLSKELARIEAAQQASAAQVSELLRLRGEVGLLRGASNEVVELRQANERLRSQLESNERLAPQKGATPAGAPFQIQLVADGPGEDSELMTNNAAGRPQAAQETLYVEKTPLLGQNAVQSATVVNDPLGQPNIRIQFTEQGREKFAEITKQNINKRLAILIDGKVYSAPVIRTEISGGQAEISGSFTEQEAQELAAKINQSLASQ